MGTLNHDRPILVRKFGVVDYGTCHAAMRRHVASDAPRERDELWLLQHHRVFTLGVRGGSAPLQPADDPIPVVATNRGGLATYHGPGQVIAYPLIRLAAIGMGVRALVNNLEQSVIDVLAEAGVSGARRPDAPGVYVGAEKIASLGLRVSRGISYHGVSINVEMDLEPFLRIDPCGLGVRMTQLSAFTPCSPEFVAERFAACLVDALAYAPQRVTIENACLQQLAQ